MRTAGLYAYIISGVDEHLNTDVAERDRRRQFISGFAGAVGDAVVTADAVAVWTNDRYVAQANYELACEWKIFSTDRVRSGEHRNMTDWLLAEVPAEACVGADPSTVPHVVWHRWEAQLRGKFIRLLRVNRNLVDEMWPDRPAANTDAIRVHGVYYAGERFGAKLAAVRQYLREHEADAMIVSALTEIAWVLNLRGNDLPYTPVFKVSIMGY